MGDADSMWDAMTNCIREMTREMCVSKGHFSKHRRDWWWNEKVKGKVEAEKGAYAKLVQSKDGEEKQKNRKDYKIARKEAKFAITTSKDAFFESLYTTLKDKSSDKKLYMLIKVRERQTRDLDQVKCKRMQRTKF